MTSSWGDQLKISLFGESHGAAIGAVIDGLPAGIPIDPELIKLEMSRRSARGKALATPRKEPDEVEIVSGYFNGKTTGTPLAGLIRNHNTHSGDYSRTRTKMRPGHADYTGWLRYKGYQDYRGGGHFSGRLTAPMVFAGAVAKQVLMHQMPSLYIGSRIVSIGQVSDHKHVAPEQYDRMKALNPMFPVLTESIKDEMEKQVETARDEQDSVGGIIEGVITGMPGGWGNPIFESVESRLSALLFAIPAVKGVEFGSGFDIATMRGSEANDPFFIEGGQVRTRTNCNGGINGGITNGMPVVFRVAFKPTPSIARKQHTIDMEKQENTTIAIEGRHDPCIVLRAAPVVEAVTALCILDLSL